MQTQANLWGEAGTPITETTVATLENLCKLIAEQRIVCDDISDLKKEAEKKCADLENQLLEHLNALGKTSYDSNVGKFSITHRASVKIPRGEDWRLFREYLDQSGAAHMLTVNSQTLNGWYKDELNKAKEAGTAHDFSVPGIAGPSITQIISFRSKK